VKEKERVKEIQDMLVSMLAFFKVKLKWSILDVNIKETNRIEKFRNTKQRIENKIHSQGISIIKSYNPMYATL
jgi:hypothetical protein